MSASTKPRQTRSHGRGPGGGGDTPPGRPDRGGGGRSGAGRVWLGFAAALILSIGGALADVPSAFTAAYATAAFFLITTRDR